MPVQRAAGTHENQSGYNAMSIRAILFDFGGVLAEEGFREGLYAIARRAGLDPIALHRLGLEAVYDSGYVVGQGSEADFWGRLRRRSGVRGDDAELAGGILRRFVPRPWMINLVRELRRQGFTIALLSDQTDWLDRLDARDHFYGEFDRRYISYYLGKSKRDASLFDDVARDLGVEPRQALFVDDDAGNVERARSRGMRAILFKNEEDFAAQLRDTLGRDIMHQAESRVSLR